MDRLLLACTESVRYEDVDPSYYSVDLIDLTTGRSRHVANLDANLAQVAVSDQVIAVAGPVYDSETGAVSVWIIHQ